MNAKFTEIVSQCRRPTVELLMEALSNRQIAIDLGDLEWGTLKIQAGSEIDVPDGMRTWWTLVNNEPEEKSVMYMEFYFELSENSQYISLWLKSEYDIFRPLRFGATPNNLHAVLTFERLMSYLSKLAEQMSGVLEIYPDLANFFSVTK
ncbi:MULTISPECIES: hypothetical protein [Nostocales]